MLPSQRESPPHLPHEQIGRYAQRCRKQGDAHPFVFGLSPAQRPDGPRLVLLDAGERVKHHVSVHVHNLRQVGFLDPGLPHSLVSRQVEDSDKLLPGTGFVV